MTLGEMMGRFDRLTIRRCPNGTVNVYVERKTPEGYAQTLDAQVKNVEAAIELVEALAKEGA